MGMPVFWGAIGNQRYCGNWGPHHRQHGKWHYENGRVGPAVSWNPFANLNTMEAKSKAGHDRCT